jgi:hypothetical protein
MSTETAPMIAPSQNAPQTTVPKDSPQHRTIYDASGFEVFAKHFLAGFSQALGMILRRSDHGGSFGRHDKIIAVFDESVSPNTSFAKNASKHNARISIISQANN